MLNKLSSRLANDPTVASASIPGDLKCQYDLFVSETATVVTIGHRIADT